MVWLDGLDIPIVTLLDTSFAEQLDQDSQPLGRREGDALARYGSGLLPDGYTHASHTSPVFNYPYERSRETLEALKAGSEPDACHGWKLKYTNPLDGEYAMPTMATHIQLLAAGATMPYKSTDATVFTCVEGSGKTTIGDVVVEWGPKDIFVVPSWKPVVHEPSEESVLFSYSDRPVQEKLGLWRESRGNN